MWFTAQISFEILDDMTDDPVVAVLVSTPVGKLSFMAEIAEEGSTLLLQRVHVQGASPNTIGSSNLRVIAQALLERMGFDELVVEGAVRTTGAKPGRRPGALRFTRNVPSVPRAAAP